VQAARVDDDNNNDYLPITLECYRNHLKRTSAHCTSVRPAVFKRCAAFTLAYVVMQPFKTFSYLAAARLTRPAVLVDAFATIFSPDNM
jgi:hypothetical protein